MACIEVGVAETVSGKAEVTANGRGEDRWPVCCINTRSAVTMWVPCWEDASEVTFLGGSHPRAQDLDLHTDVTLLR